MPFGFNHPTSKFSRTAIVLNKDTLICLFVIQSEASTIDGKVGTVPSPDSPDPPDPPHFIVALKLIVGE